MTFPLVKVCCITSKEEALMALDAGANLLGLVSEMPSGPGVISLEEIANLVRQLPSGTKTVLLTSKRSQKEILHQHEQVKTWGIQMVDSLAKTELKVLRFSLPKVHLIQVIHVKDKSSVSAALVWGGYVDTILLDSGNPRAKIKTLGGTGQTHDWSLSREIVEKSSVPVLLAGGLNPDNIGAAHQAVHPHGFDVCSGVRTGGKLDRDKLERFMHHFHHNNWDSL